MHDAIHLRVFILLLTWLGVYCYCVRPCDTQQVSDGVCERFLPRSEAADDQRSRRDAGDQGVGVWGARGAAQGIPRSGIITVVTPHVTN